jgi:uncharacterized protein (TIGR02594 family)
MSGCIKSEVSTIEDKEPITEDVVEVDSSQITKIDIALRYLNLHEKYNRKELKEFIGVDPVKIEWCAAFVNSVLGERGIPGSNTVSEWPLTARSFLRWGKRVKEPQLGDIVIFPRGTEAWQGHVGFYYGTEYVKGIKYYQILGGNQDDAVTIKLFPARTAISIRRFHNNLLR